MYNAKFHILYFLTRICVNIRTFYFIISFSIYFLLRSSEPFLAHFSFSKIQSEIDIKRVGAAQCE